MKTKRVLLLILLIVPLLLIARAKDNIKITVKPGDAFVYLNGKPPIRTDKNGIAVIPNVPHGKHEIVIKKDGYKSLSRTITVNQDSTLFQFELEEKIILQISCNVAGAEIFIKGEKEGKKVGVTDSNGNKTIESISREGAYELEIKHKCFATLKENIKLKKGLNKPSNLSLVEIKEWELPIWCDVPDAEIVIDDRTCDNKTKERDFVTVKLSPGNHIICIKKDGYKSETKEVSIIKCSSQKSVYFEMSTLRDVLIRALLIALIFFVLVSASVIFVTLLRASKKNRTMGKFELVKKIGSGGIATIFKAKDKMEKKVVALKILNPTLGNDTDIVSKFYREGETLSRINEEFPDAPVVKVFDYGNREKSLGVPYISMQWLKGDNLLKIIKGKKELTVEYKLYIAREIVSGLIAAHKLEITHGDITPDNIIVKNKKVTLIAFGTAVDEHNNIKNTDPSLKGKPVYMSPEQCTGIPIAIGEKSDIYSLGIILFVLFQGTPPFTAKNPDEIKKMHRESPLPEMAPRVPTDIKEIIVRMLDKEPGNRPRAIELKEILEKLILKYKLGSIK